MLPVMHNEPMIGTREACDVLGVNRSTLTRWVAAGRITPVTRLPGTTGAYVFRRADIDAIAQAA